ncbi:porin family protein [Thalassomonas viridans]|uniref:Porin family protein n=1 Tax=Thalassomonas viridans TaxID=137584 RepID=A0AAE9Z249_9GAMM|nr:porin family protein [Thalassomonas viridans]WDE05230.1 porin family protein [Thalassomonas viridans]
MFKKTAIALSMMCLPLTASAQWLAGGGYVNFSDDVDGIDLSLSAVYGSLAYKVESADSAWSFMPEIRLGSGISDDKESGIKFEIERYFAVSARAQYDYSNGVFVFVTPSYANLDNKVSFQYFSESDDEWDFGIGAGLGFNVNENVTIEASYDRYDDVDAFGVGIKYAF